MGNIPSIITVAGGASTTTPIDIKTLSENLYLAKDQLSTGQVKKGEVVHWAIFTMKILNAFGEWC